NWPQYLYSPGHTSANTVASVISRGNGGRLRLAWTFAPKAPGMAGFLSSPTVFNGVIYIGARSGHFYALNESTGAVIWKRFIGFVPRLTCGTQGFTSTATAAPDPPTGYPTRSVSGSTAVLSALNPAARTHSGPP